MTTKDSLMASLMGGGDHGGDDDGLFQDVALETGGTVAGSNSVDNSMLFASATQGPPPSQSMYASATAAAPPSMMMMNGSGGAGPYGGDSMNSNNYANNNNNNNYNANNNNNNYINTMNHGMLAPAGPSSVHSAPPPSVPAMPAAAPPPAMGASLLAASGLLMAGGSGGGGLFDDIDQEEEERQRQEQQRLFQLQQQQEAEAARRRAAEEEAARRKAEEEALRRAAAEERQRQQAAEQERLRREQEQQQKQQQLLQQQQQQQLADQMQSIHLGNPLQQQQQQQQYPYQQNKDIQQQQPPYQQQPQQQPQPSNMQQSYMQQQQSQQQPPPFSPPQQQQQVVQDGFYRQHPTPPAATMAPQPAQTSIPSNVYSGGGGASAAGSPYRPQQQQQGLPPQYNNHNSLTPSSPPPAGAHMHMSPHHMQHPQQVMSMTVSQPPPPPAFYGKITVSDPLLIQSPGGLLGFKQAPHWSYQIVSQVLPPPAAPGQSSLPPQTWLVRRRFRHVVALEDRLRNDCPGAILPPRPDKHAVRALEEATTQQSADFAKQRVMEIETYLNQLAHHPIAAGSPLLRLFLALQDDLGTAWPECSLNALTRLANAGVGAAVQLSEATTSATASGKFPWDTTGPSGSVDGMNYQHDSFEDNAELLALQSSENVRMGAVTQGVPKLEGAVTLLREHAEAKGAVGVELGKLAKDTAPEDRDIAIPLEMLSHGMLRDGRRSRRLSVELESALKCFSQHYKLCRYEKMAFSDRRNALVRRSKERGKADQRAAQLYLQQRQHQQYYGGAAPPYGGGGYPGGDDYAVDAVRECEEIGSRLKLEINRVAWERRTDWHAAVRVMANSLKEASTERLQIWTQAKESFLNAFPDQRES